MLKVLKSNLTNPNQPVTYMQVSQIFPYTDTDDWFYAGDVNDDDSDDEGEEQSRTESRKEDRSHLIVWQVFINN